MLTLLAGRLPAPEVPVAASGLLYYIQAGPSGGREGGAHGLLAGPAACVLRAAGQPDCLPLRPLLPSNPLPSPPSLPTRPQSLVFMIPLGLSFSVSCRVGAHLGAGDPRSARLAGACGLHARAGGQQAAAVPQ